MEDWLPLPLECASSDLGQSGGEYACVGRVAERWVSVPCDETGEAFDNLAVTPQMPTSVWPFFIPVLDFFPVGNHNCNSAAINSPAELPPTLIRMRDGKPNAEECPGGVRSCFGPTLTAVNSNHEMQNPNQTASHRMNAAGPERV